jgi:hypothetical protein
MEYALKIFKVFACAFFTFLSLCTYLDAASLDGSYSPLFEEHLQSRKCTSLDSLSLQPLSPGVYESDDIEAILSHALRDFGSEDVVIFDIDDVLITQRLDPFYFVHAQNQTPLFERFDLLGGHIKDMLFFYLFVSGSPELISFMDERTPKLIRSLQTRGIKCIGNTALNPIWCGGPIANFDAAAARLKLLNELGVSFSDTFSHLGQWDFDTLPEEHTIQSRPLFNNGIIFPSQGRPLFKNGIIFSGPVPKHVTQHELFKKVGILPRKVMFVDDIMENVYGMQNFMSSLGIECFSFCYSKKESKPLPRYFTDEIYERELKILEGFVGKLLVNERVHSYFLESYSKEFMRAEEDWIYLEEENKTLELDTKSTGRVSEAKAQGYRILAEAEANRIIAEAVAKAEQIKAESDTKRLAAEKRVADAKIESHRASEARMVARVPQIARGHEAVYNRFINGRLVYNGPAGERIYPIADILNSSLEGEFNLNGLTHTSGSTTYNIGDYLRIKIGYRKVKENEHKTTVWIVPQFMIDKAQHAFKSVAWYAPIGIFWSWGKYDLSDFDYLTSMEFDDISSKNLYGLGARAGRQPRARWCGFTGRWREPYGTELGAGAPGWCQVTGERMSLPGAGGVAAGAGEFFFLYF